MTKSHKNQNGNTTELGDDGSGVAKRASDANNDSSRVDMMHCWRDSVHVDVDGDIAVVSVVVLAVVTVVDFAVVLVDAACCCHGIGDTEHEDQDLPR